MDKRSVTQGGWRLVGPGPYILLLHDRPVNGVEPGRSGPFDDPLIATQVKFGDFKQATGRDCSPHQKL